jgi:hypothetical protein
MSGNRAVVRRKPLAASPLNLRWAFAALRLRPFDALDRIMGDGVPLAEILEQRGDRGEPMPVNCLKFAHRVLVGAPRVEVGDIGEPFDLGRHVGQPVELGALDVIAAIAILLGRKGVAAVASVTRQRAADTTRSN